MYKNNGENIKKYLAGLHEEHLTENTLEFKVVEFAHQVKYMHRHKSLYNYKAENYEGEYEIQGSLDLNHVFVYDEYIVPKYVIDAFVVKHEHEYQAEKDIQEVKHFHR